MKLLRIFYKNHGKPPVILGFSCHYPSTIFFTSFKKISKDLDRELLGNNANIYFAPYSVNSCNAIKIKYWVKSWVNLKKVFLSLFFISFCYTVL